MDISDEIRDAICKLTEGMSGAEVGKLLGVAHSTVNNWRNGKRMRIQPEHWKRLRPLLEPYLRKYKTPLTAIESNAEFLTEQLPTYPVISLAAAAECNTAIMPMAEFADANSEERVPFQNGRKGDVAIRIVGDSMEPWYPSGTIVLVRPCERLRNGDGVIAILADGEVVFKTYVERPDTFMLLSINEDNGCKYEFKKSDHFAVRGLYLVVGSLRDEIRLRETMHANGKHHFWEKYLQNGPETNATTPITD